MTISAEWQPDTREVYEPKLCRLRNVYRVVIARGSRYCDQCHHAITKGESHDAVAVSGSSLSGYTHPRRLHCDCRKEYIKRQNERYAEQWGILLSICMICGVYYGYKDGRGVAGLSHGICGEECEKVWEDEMCDVPEVSNDESL